MGAERDLLSYPTQVQDWLGTAADQIETLIQVPYPEKRSQCSRDLPSFIPSILYPMPQERIVLLLRGGGPTGRRKPQGRTRGRSRIMEEPVLPVETFTVLLSSWTHILSYVAVMSVVSTR